MIVDKVLMLAIWKFFFLTSEVWHIVNPDKHQMKYGEAFRNSAA